MDIDRPPSRSGSRRYSTPTGGFPSSSSSSSFPASYDPFTSMAPLGSAFDSPHSQSSRRHPSHAHSHSRSSSGAGGGLGGGGRLPSPAELLSGDRDPFGGAGMQGLTLPPLRNIPRSDSPLLKKPGLQPAKPGHRYGDYVPPLGSSEYRDASQRSPHTRAEGGLPSSSSPYASSPSSGSLAPRPLFPSAYHGTDAGHTSPTSRTRGFSSSGNVFDNDTLPELPPLTIPSSQPQRVLSRHRGMSSASSLGGSGGLDGPLSGSVGGAFDTDPLDDPFSSSSIGGADDPSYSASGGAAASDYNLATSPRSHASRGIRKFSKRSTFSHAQHVVLETLWASTEYPSTAQVDRCAEESGLTTKQVRTWFGNTRQSRLAGTRKEIRQAGIPQRSLSSSSSSPSSSYQPAPLDLAALPPLPPLSSSSSAFPGLGSRSPSSSSSSRQSHARSPSARFPPLPPSFNNAFARYEATRMGLPPPVPGGLPALPPLPMSSGGARIERPRSRRNSVAGYASASTLQPQEMGGLPGYGDHYTGGSGRY